MKSNSLRFSLLLLLLPVVQTFSPRGAQGDDLDRPPAQKTALDKGLSLDGTKLILTSNFATNEELEELSAPRFARVVKVYVNGPLNDDGLNNITRLEALRELRIDFAPITDRGLAYLKGLPLRSLAIHGPALGMQLSNPGIAQLKACPSLEELKLSGTGMTNELMGELPRFPALKSLSLWESGIDNIGLARLKGARLESLWLRGSYTSSGLFALKELPNLRRLEFYENRIDRSAFNEFLRARPDVLVLVEQRPLSDPNLARVIPDYSKDPPAKLSLFVNGSGNALTVPEHHSRIHDDDLAQLSDPRYSSLEQLTVRESTITDRGLESLRRLKNLRHVNLSGASISGLGLEHLKNLPLLESLVLGRSIGDDDLVMLRQLRSLKHLDLDSPRVSQKGVGVLKELQLQSLAFALEPGQLPLAQLAGLPVRALTLKGGALNGTELKDLHGLPLLELNLNYVALAGAGRLSGLQGLPIQYLGLSARGLNDADLLDLQGLNLRALSLERTNITDQGLVHLKPLKLDVLSVDGTRTTAEGLSALLASVPGLYVVPEKESLELPSAPATDSSEGKEAVEVLLQALEQGRGGAAEALLKRISLDTCPDYGSYLTRLSAVVYREGGDRIPWRVSWYDSAYREKERSRQTMSGAVKLVGALAECSSDALIELRKFCQANGPAETQEESLLQLCRLADPSLPGLMRDYLSRYSGNGLMEQRIYLCAYGKREYPRLSDGRNIYPPQKLFPDGRVVREFDPAVREELDRIFAGYLMARLARPNTGNYVLGSIQALPPERFEEVVPSLKRFILLNREDPAAVEAAVTLLKQAKGSERAAGVLKELTEGPRLPPETEAAVARALGRSPK